MAWNPLAVTNPARTAAAPTSPQARWRDSIPFSTTAQPLWRWRQLDLALGRDRLRPVAGLHHLRTGDRTGARRGPALRPVRPHPASWSALQGAVADRDRHQGQCRRRATPTATTSRCSPATATWSTSRSTCSTASAIRRRTCSARAMPPACCSRLRRVRCASRSAAPTSIPCSTPAANSPSPCASTCRRHCRPIAPAWSLPRSTCPTRVRRTK